MLDRLAPPVERVPDGATRRRMVILSALSLTLAVVVALYVPVFVWMGQTGLGVFALVLSVLYGVAPVVIRAGGFVPARAVVLTLFVAVPFVYADVLGAETGLPAMLFVTSLIALVVCDLREWGWIAYGLGLGLAATLWLQVMGTHTFGDAQLDATLTWWLALLLAPTNFVLLVAEVGYFAFVSARARAEAASRHEAVVLLLDNIDQGFLQLDASGVVRGERSAAVATLLGDVAVDVALWDSLAQEHPQEAAWLELAWESLAEGFMPLEISLSQLPAALQRDGRHLHLSWRPLGRQGDTFEALMLVVTDETAEVLRQRTEAEQSELAEVFTRLQRDPSGVRGFFREAAALVASLRGDTIDRAGQLRALHTLKGNFALFGLASVAARVHRLEDAVVDSADGMGAEDRQALDAIWQDVQDRLGGLVGSEDTVAVPRQELAQLEGGLARGSRHEQLLQVVRGWQHESADVRLEHLKDQAMVLASKLGKPDLSVGVDGGDVRLPAQAWQPLWASLVHVVRNAVDHGIEAPEVRRSQGKSESGRLTLSCASADDAVVLVVADDGGGVDWQRVAAKAQQAGLPHGTHEQLVQALFSDGLSTREQASEVSGRGVGLAAVLESVQTLGGTLDVQSTPGQGTRFVIRVPAERAVRAAA